MMQLQPYPTTKILNCSWSDFAASKEKKASDFDGFGMHYEGDGSFRIVRTFRGEVTSQRTFSDNVAESFAYKVAYLCRENSWCWPDVVVNYVARKEGDLWLAQGVALYPKRK